MRADQEGEDMKMVKSFKLVGQIVLQEGLCFLKTMVEGTRKRVYEDLHAVSFASDDLAKAAGELKYASVLGTFENDSMGDTYMLVHQVTKALKKDENINLALVHGRVHGFEFFPPAEGKKQFGSLTANIEGTFMNLTVFRGVASYLNAKAEYGAGFEASGRNRRDSFEDSEGNLRYSVDVVANRVRITTPALQTDHFQEMLGVAAFIDSDDSEKSEAV